MHDIVPQTKPTQQRLLCGCIVGHYACQEAERLWKEYQAIYHEVLIGDATQAELDAACKAYYHHYISAGLVLP